MVIHASIISPLFIVAFVITYITYYRSNPKRRVMNSQFPLMVFTILSAFAYPVVNKSLRGQPVLAPISYAFLVFAVASLGLAWFLYKPLTPTEAVKR